MIDFLSLYKSTNVYKIIKAEKEEDKLSHAYLIINSDLQFQDEYLSLIAKTIVCENDSPCNECRLCKLVSDKKSADVLFYPKNNESVLTEDVIDLIEESYIKPIEGNKKVFVIKNADTMNERAQNKLLKTLEEPPKNVHIIIGVKNQSTLIETLKSRVKKLEISTFSYELLYNALKDELRDLEKLKRAISLSVKTVESCVNLYNDKNLSFYIDLVKDLLINMKTSREVLTYSNRLSGKNIDFNEFLSVLELVLSDMLKLSLGESKLNFDNLASEIFENSKGFNSGALVYIIEKITQARKRKKSNANPTMLIEWLLFQILEGKYKWQKS